MLLLLLSGSAFYFLTLIFLLHFYYFQILLPVVSTFNKVYFQFVSSFDINLITCLQHCVPL